MSQFESEGKNITLEDLELRSRTYGVLKRGGINGVEELLTLSLHELSEFRNMGRKDLQVLLETLIPSWMGSIHSLLKDYRKKNISLAQLLMMLKEER